MTFCVSSCRHRLSRHGHPLTFICVFVCPGFHIQPELSLENLPFLVPQKHTVLWTSISMPFILSFLPQCNFYLNWCSLVGFRHVHQLITQNPDMTWSTFPEVKNNFCESALYYFQFHSSELSSWLFKISHFPNSLKLQAHEVISECFPWIIL